MIPNKKYCKIYFSLHFELCMYIVYLKDKTIEACTVK